MNNNQQIFSIVIFSLILGLILLVGFFLIPWKLVKWGIISITPSQVITVTGEAKTDQKNQLAVFSAGVSSVNDNKDTAITDVNKKIEGIINAVKTFGIPQEDIKTQNLSIYQQEETYYDEAGRQKSRPSQWRVNNTVEIKLRNVERASELADLLSKSGANNVYGPNFTVDDTKETESSLLDEAIKDARSKAEIIAKSSNRKLGKIISISEGSSAPLYPLRSSGLGAGGGAPVEPGTQTVQKTVTVTFEIE